MIYIGILDATGLPLSASLAANLSASERARIEATGSEELKRARLAARLLLAALYREHVGAALPEICYTGEGKPFFADGSAAFSLAHSGALCAVALAPDSEALGVDIQAHPESGERLARAVSRFTPAALSLRESAPLPLEWSFFRTGANGIVRCSDFCGIALLSLGAASERVADAENDIFVIKEDSFHAGAQELRRWCALEALGKLDGRGLVRAAIEDASASASIKSLFLSHGGVEYGLCVAALGTR